MRRKRVLLVLHELHRTGAPILALECFRSLAGEVELLTVAARDGELRRDFEALGETVVYPPAPRYSSFFGRLVVRRHRLIFGPVLWRVRSFAPDVLYANSLASVGYLQELPVQPQSRVLHCHELGQFAHEALQGHEEDVRGWGGLVIANSDATSEYLTNELGVPEGCVRTTKAFVRVPEASPPLPGVLTIGGNGRGMWRKGFETWLVVAREVRRRLPDGAVRFEWQGATEGTEGERMHRMLAKAGLADVVDLPSPYTDIDEGMARISLMATTSWEETFSLATAEAMARGRPAACFRQGGGAVEVVGDAGIVADDHDPLAMGAAIAEVASDARRLRELGDRARSRIEERFSQEVGVPAWQRVVREALGD